MEHTVNTEEKLDFKKAKANVFVSVAFKVILLVLSFFVRRLLIYYLGNDVNGLNTLFNSILSFLAVVELGIGTAITFCMYEPIVQNDKKKVAGLYNLFKKIYLFVGLSIILFGSIVSIFLPFLAKGYQVDSIAYISYYIYLVGVALTYFYSAKMSLINAYKNNYVSTIFTSLGLLAQYILQVVVLVFTKSFIAFCLCKLICSIIQLVLFSTFGKYKEITKDKATLDEQTKKEVSKNIKALFMHKMGDVIFGTVDSLVISFVIGVAMLGYYSNYLLVLTAMNEVIKLFVVSLTSVVGHMGIKASSEEKIKYFRNFYIVNFIVGATFYLGYYAVADSVVSIFLGKGLLLSKDLLIVMTITHFIQYLRQTVSLFKDSFGLFYHDRYNAIFAAIVNAALSIWFAYLWGIYGVLIATIVVDLFIYNIVEPYVLYKRGFHNKPAKYYITNYTLIIIFAIVVICFGFIPNKFAVSEFLNMLIRGSLSVAISAAVCSPFFFDKQFAAFLKTLLKRKKQNEV